MRKNSSILPGSLVAIAVLLTLAGHLLSISWLSYLFKPLATLLLFSIAFSHWFSHRNPYALWIAIGLLFSLAGDVALLWPALYFLLGLAAFLLTHIAYLIAFTRDAKFPARLVIWLLYLAIAGAFYALLFPNLPNNLKAPVAFYALLLASMTAQATGRSLVLKTQPARLAAMGAILFMLSDLLLAFDRFHTALLLAPVLILIPYYLAQWLIALSTARS